MEASSTPMKVPQSCCSVQGLILDTFVDTRRRSVSELEQKTQASGSTAGVQP